MQECGRNVCMREVVNEHVSYGPEILYPSAFHSGAGSPLAGGPEGEGGEGSRLPDYLGEYDLSGPRHDKRPVPDSDWELARRHCPLSLERRGNTVFCPASHEPPIQRLSGISRLGPRHPSR